MQIQQLITLAATVLLSGWLAAVIVQLVKRESWPSWLKLAVALVVSGLVGLAAAWLSGDVTRFVTLWRAGALTSDQVVAFGVLVFTSAQVWYHRFFQDQGWARSLGAWGSSN